MSVALLTVEALREVPHDAEGRPLVVDARPRAAYLEGHIPGARHMAWEEWCAPGPTSNHPITGQPGYWGRLEDDSAHARTHYARQLEAHGVTHAQPVVVYADGAPSKGREGRIAWMLLYLGVRDVALLDGGWSAWRLAGGPVAPGAEPAPSSACSFSGVIQARRRALLPTLRQAYAAGRLPLPIDTRAAADFAGHVLPTCPAWAICRGPFCCPTTTSSCPLATSSGVNATCGGCPPGSSTPKRWSPTVRWACARPRSRCSTKPTPAGWWPPTMAH